MRSEAEIRKHIENLIVGNLEWVLGDRDMEAHVLNMAEDAKSIKREELQLLGMLAQAALTGMLSNPAWNHQQLERLGVAVKDTPAFLAKECYAYAQALAALILQPPEPTKGA